MAIHWIAGTILLKLLSTVSTQVVDNCLPLPTPPNFTDDQQVLDFVEFNVTCALYNLQVTMSTCALQQLGYNPTTDLAVGNYSSSSVLTRKELDGPWCFPYDDGLGSTVFRFNLTSCHPTIVLEQSGANMSYLYAVRNVLNGSETTVFRGNSFSVPFTCGYPLSMRDSLQYSVLGVYLQSPVRMKTQRGLQNVLMGLFQDSKFRLPITSQPNEFPRVKLTKTIHVGLTINTDETYLALAASSCWVTNSLSLSDPHRFDILKNGCPAAEAESMGLVRLYRNFNATTVEMSFRPFTWGYTASSAQKMYVHCKVSVCDWVLDQKCIEKFCPEVEPGANDGDGKDITKAISLGPISIEAETTICSQANGGCSHFCSVHNDGSKICHCPASATLQPDGRNCKSNQNKEVMKIHPRPLVKRSVMTSSQVEGSHDWLGAFLIFVGLLFVISISRAGRMKRSGKGRLDL